jgi:hypothetical protein
MNFRTSRKGSVLGARTKKGNRSRLLLFFPSPSMGEDMVGVDFSTDGTPHPNPPPQGGRGRERLRKKHGAG